MLKHRLIKIGKVAFVTLCALFVSGSFCSCEDALDDYSYDDGGEPSWLGSSVYDFLRDNESGHTYNYYADIVDQLGETETFRKTGSKTVFVADDAAFERFFANNSWGVKSFDELSESQKRILLKASMLNDPMLLDMLSSGSADEATIGTCLRRTTSLSTEDSIPLILAADAPKFNRYWDILRGKERDEKMLLVMGSGEPMMVHILPDYLKNKGLSEEDITFLFRKNGVQTKTYKDGEAFIYDKKIVASDIPMGEFSDDTMTITCKNGYLYRLDDVLLPPSNMAAEIRNHPETSIFSYLLDRFCLPVYDSYLTGRYRVLYNGSETDTVYRLRYYAKNKGLSANDDIIKTGKPSVDCLLKFDPAANDYIAQNVDVKADMGAIFAPNDAALYKYFTEKDGKLIFAQYNNPTSLDYVEVTDYESLKLALNNVPDAIIASLINITMQESFVSSAYSRFNLIVDDGMDAINTYSDIKIQDAVTECIIANNGVVYILNNVYGPSEYSTVNAPCKLLDNMKVINKIFQQLDYSSFLLAKAAKYSLIVPDDKSFIYYDPVSLIAKRQIESLEDDPKVYQLFFDNKNDKIKNTANYLYAKEYNFNADTYELVPPKSSTSGSTSGSTGGSTGGSTDGSTDGSTGTTQPTIIEGEYWDEGQCIAESSSVQFFGSNTFLFNRMSDLVDYLIVIGEFTPERKYYLAKNGGALKVDFSNPLKPIFQGGEQVETGTYITTSEVYPGQLNGATYTTVPVEESTNTRLYSGVPTPSTKSLYEQLNVYAASDADPFFEFMKLAEPAKVSCDIDQLLSTIFTGTDVDIDSVKKAYSVFYTPIDEKTKNPTNTQRNAVPFLGGFNYTVYVPSNSAVKDIVNEGLPSWADIEACAEGTGIYASDGAAPLKALAAMGLLRDFMRYHFHDNSIFVDGVTFDKDYETLLVGDKSTFLTVNTRTENGTIVVTDELGTEAKVVTTAGAENKTWNILSRDFTFETKGKDPAVPDKIVISSFSVAHELDKVLRFKSLYGYDGMIQRFAKNGEKVNIMSVTGNTSDGLYNAPDGTNYYLVADAGTVTFTTASGVSSVKSLGYLMKPRTGSYTKMTREDYVYDENNELILITNDGYRVKYDDKGNLVFWLDDNNNMLKYANNGSVLEMVPATN